METPIRELNLDKRSENALLRDGYKFIEELIHLSEADLYMIRNVGSQSVKKIQTALTEYLEKQKSITKQEINPTIDRKITLEESYDKTMQNIFVSDYLPIFLKCFSFYQLGISESLLNELEDLGISNLYKALSLVGNKELPTEYQKTLQSLFDELSSLACSDGKIPLSPVMLKKKNSIQNQIVKDCLSSFPTLDIGRLYANLDPRVQEYLHINHKNTSHTDFLVSDYGREFFESSFFQSLVDQKIYDFIDHKPRGIEDSELLDFMPNWIPTSLLRKTLLEFERKEVIKRNSLGLKVIKRPTLQEYIGGLTIFRHKRIIRDRFRGKTLEVIRQEEGVTRERIRQISHNILRRMPQIEEDGLAYYFQRYALKQDEFCEIFNVIPEVYGYLKLKYNQAGTTEIDFLLTDEDIPEIVRKRTKQVISKDALFINNQKILKKKNDIIEYLITKYLNRKLTIEEFYIIYNDFLSKFNLGNDPILKTSLQAFERLLSRFDNVLFSLGKTILFYDFENTDFTNLLQTLDLEQYQDVELSTLLFYENYPELMEEYSLPDHYFLHNLLKKLFSQKKTDFEIEFGRMPTIRIGNPDILEQISQIIIQQGPITRDELAEIMRNEYGLDTGTVISNYLREFNDYYQDGLYDFRLKKFDQEHTDFFRSNLTKDYYPVRYVKDLFEKTFDADANDYFTRAAFHDLGFTLSDHSIVSNEYGSLREYLDIKIKNKGVFAETDFDPELVRLMTYKSHVYSLQRSGDIIEFLPKQYITTDKLNENGITDEMLDKFRMDVYDWDTKGAYFTIISLEKSGFSSDLSDFGFEQFFYESILSSGDKSKRMPYIRYGGQKIFYKGDEKPSVGDFITELITLHGDSEVYDLCDLLKEEYGISVDRYKLVRGIIDTDLYYDDVFETIYISYDNYLEGAIE